MYKVDNSFYIKGNEDVNRFKEIFLNNSSNLEVRMPTKIQDMTEHWDIEFYNPVKSIKIDVKGLKYKKRNDGNPLDIEFWVELVGNTGHLGWVYGKADYIAFEAINEWLIVDREELSKLAEKLCKNGKLVYNVYEARNNMYQRKNWGRIDQTTIVYKKELLSLSKTKIIKK